MLVWKAGSRQRAAGSKHARRPLPTIRCLLPAACCLLLTGCVQRTLTIETDPPGALVYLNNQEVGRTPMSTDFTWYGRYDVQIRHEGHETLKTTAKVGAPIWQFPPIDLLAELFPLHDRQRLRYTLTPLPPGPADPEPLLDRAYHLRDRLD